MKIESEVCVCFKAQHEMASNGVALAATKKQQNNKKSKLNKQTLLPMRGREM
jgi:hypothetical protein